MISIYLCNHIRFYDRKEGIILIICLHNRISRQSYKEAAKEEIVLEEKQQLQYTLQELALNIERQDAQIRHLQRTVAELESRKWLPRIPMLSSNKDDDDIEQKPKTSNEPTNNDGNYDRNCGIVLKSLDLIENEIFYSATKDQTNGSHRIIHDALVYLKLN